MLDGVLETGAFQDLRDDPRVKPLRKQTPEGMRPAINDAARLATGEFLMKCDGHCIFAEGFDATLKADCDGDWLVVPTRHSIAPETWTVCGPSGRKADLVNGGYNYHYLTFPYALSMYGYGIHGKTFEWKQNCALNVETRAVQTDDLMSFQGSCWFQPTEYFLRLGPLDHEAYYFYSESIESGLRVWMSGGRCAINKKTWYAHYHKGRENVGADGRLGRGFYLDVRRKRQSEAYATDFWMNDKWPGATRTFAWLIDHFWPLLQRIPAREAWRWPEDWADPKYRFDFLNRPEDAIPAHT